MKNRIFKTTFRLCLMTYLVGSLSFLSISNSVSVVTASIESTHVINKRPDITNSLAEHDENNNSKSPFYQKNKSYERHEEEQVLTRGVEGLGNCGGISCGPGREGGYNTNYLSVGCRNWAKLLHMYSPKYWIDESTLSNLTAEEKEQFITNVDGAADKWNSTYMHDGTGTIVTLEKYSSNGLGICPVRYDGSLGDLGQYNYLLNTIKINDISEGTILHEFGHLLGLNDLDSGGQSTWVHNVAMGYNTMLDEPLHYQDIMGLAAIKTNHTHDYKRHIWDGSKYTHFCFYCDIGNTQSSIISGSSAMQLAANCVHIYEQVVSAGDRHWIRCTKCYRVDESIYMVQGMTGETVILNGVLSPLSGFIMIPAFLNGRTVTQIGEAAFSGQTGLTRITIPETVTHIKSDAFNNTNNARIDLVGRTSSPSTFDPNWNPANNPVYFNGVQCLHPHKTLTYLSGSSHGLMCETCRTTTNVTAHPAINLWRDYYQHHSKCSCGLNQLRGHVVASSDPGYPYKTCLYCGGPAKDAVGQYDKGNIVMTVVPSFFVEEYFGYNSYLLQNGIYVIADEDITAFYDGTLILPEARNNYHEPFGLRGCRDCIYN